MVNSYKEYEWNEGPENSHSYLFKDLLKLITKNDNKMILDVGCGNGEIASRLLNLGFNIYGIDASESGITIAKKKYPNNFYLHDVTSKQLPQEIQNIKFDTIISTEVIEHLYDPRSYVDFCKSILQKNGGGELILSAPYHGYWKNLMLAFIGAMDKHFTVLWDGGHIKFWSKKTLTQMLEEKGFNVVKFLGSGRCIYLWKSMFIKAVI